MTFNVNDYLLLRRGKAVPSMFSLTKQSLVCLLIVPVEINDHDHDCNQFMPWWYKEWTRVWKFQKSFLLLLICVLTFGDANVASKVILATSMGDVHKKSKISLDVKPEEFREIGGNIMKRANHGSQEKFAKRWSTHFAVDADVIAECWKRLEVDIDERIPGNVEPSHLLWAILFLTQYTTYSDLSGKCGNNNAVDEDTFSKWIWIFIECIASLEDEASCKLLLYLTVSGSLQSSCLVS